MHSITDNATRTRALAVWVDPTMSRRVTMAQRATRMGRALLPVAYGLSLGLGLVAGRLFGPII